MVVLGAPVDVGRVVEERMEECVVTEKVGMVEARVIVLRPKVVAVVALEVVVVVARVEEA